MATIGNWSGPMPKALQRAPDGNRRCISATTVGVAGAPHGTDMLSLNELMCGKVSRTSGAGGMAMYKSVGSGLQDVVVAGMILDLARSAGLATSLPIRFEPKRIG